MQSRTHPKAEGIQGVGAHREILGDAKSILVLSPGRSMNER